MKKTFLFALVLLFACAFALSGCDKEPTQCEHTFSEWVTLEQATCAQEGKLTRTCSKCSETEETIVSKITTHTEVIDAAVDPTCTETGLTEGKHCSVCNEILVAQETVAALNHTEVIDAAVAPTCKDPGLTEGKHCSVCDEVLVEQEKIAVLDHVEVIDAAVAPTCVKTGLTEGKHCSVCDTVLVKQEIVAELGHTAVTDGAVAPTCTATGLAEGSHCSVCHIVLVEQKVLDKIPHTPTTDKAVAPTCTATGLTEGSHCSECNAILVKQEVLDKIPHTPTTDKAVDPTCSATGLTEGSHCSECNAVLVEQEVLDKLPHTPATDIAVEPTCSTTGLTEGSHCSVCNAVLVAQQVVAKKEHTPSDWITDTEATCSVLGAKHKECSVCHTVLETETIDKLPHTPATDAAVESTCSTTGLTEGSHCSVCNAVLVAQQVVAKKEHTPSAWITDINATCSVDGAKHKECTVCHTVLATATIDKLPHTPTTDAAVESTCSTTGLTEGSHCSVCNAVLVAQQVVAKKPHTTSDWITDTNPTCSIAGTKHKECSVCHTALENGMIDKIAHTPATDAAVESTCSTTGLTEGSHCSVCNAVLVAQRVVAKKNHNSVIDPAVKATCTSTGLTEGSHCSVCGETLVAQTIIAKLNHTEVIDKAVAPTCTAIGLTEGKHCSVCKKTLVVQTIVAKLDHTEVIDKAVAPTCTATGLTEGKHCLVCNATLVEQLVVEATGHTDGDWIIDEAATKTEDGSKHQICSECNITLRHERIPATGSLGLTYSVNADGKTCTVTGIGACTDTELIIGEYIDGYKVTAIGYVSSPNIKSVQMSNNVVYIDNNAFAFCISLESIVIPDSVTAMGYRVFEGCANLKNVTLSNSLTSISASEFYRCTSLESITIPNGVTFIGGSAFSGCTNLKNITIPNSVTSIGTSAFYSCTSLESITIPNSVASIGLQAFYSCTSLESITIPSSVIFIDQGAFNSSKFGIIYCEAKSLPNGWNSSWCDSSAIVVWDCNSNDIASDGYIHVMLDGINYGIKNGVAKVLRVAPAIETACIPENIVYKDVAYKVISIDQRAFYECTGLTSITIPDSVTSIGNYAFYNCTALEEIYFNATAMDDLPSLNYVFNNAGNKSDGIKVIIGANVKKIPAYLFYPGSSFPNMVSVEFESGSACTSIGAYSFYRCNNLTSITIPSSVTSIGENAFYDCTALEEIYFNATAMGNLTSSSYVFNNAGNKSDGIKVIIGANVKKIPAYLFYPKGSSSPNIVSVEFEDGSARTSIGAYSFYSCNNLTSIILPDRVTSIGHSAFKGCSGLTSLTIGNGVTSIGDYAFSGCTSLTNITIPNSATSIGNCAFIGCTSLTNITIPDSVTSIGSNAFDSCTSLTSATIGNGVTSIGNSAFSDCTNLTSLTIGNGVTSIGESTFKNCTALEEIYFNATAMDNLSYSDATFFNAGTAGDGIKVIIGANVTKIPASLFRLSGGHPKIVSVEFEPGSVCTSIGTSSFYKCNNLTSITIPNSVTSIGSDAFYGCSGLESIIFEGTIKQWSEITKNDSWNSLTGNYTIYCLDGTIAKDGTIKYYPNVTYTVNDDGTTCTITGMIDSTKTELYIPEEIDGYKVTAIGSGAFRNCTNLKKITIPDSVTSIGKSVFYGCTGLTNITIPDSVTSIGDLAFINCTGLTSITIFDSVTNIGSYVFGGCTSLTNITIPDSVTSIGDKAFEHCTSLTNITIPSSVTSIGRSVFYGSGLESIIFEGTTKQWSEISKDANWNEGTANYTIYCLNGTIAKDGTIKYYPTVGKPTTATPATSTTEKGNYIYEITKSEAALTVDGVMDEAYANGIVLLAERSLPVNHASGKYSDSISTIYVYATADENNIYFFYEFIKDEGKVYFKEDYAASSWHHLDCVDFVLSLGAMESAGTEFHILGGVEGAKGTAKIKADPAAADVDNWYVKHTTEGYTVEFSIPLEKVVGANKDGDKMISFTALSTITLGWPEGAASPDRVYTCVTKASTATNEDKANPSFLVVKGTAVEGGPERTDDGRYSYTLKAGKDALAVDGVMDGAYANGLTWDAVYALPTEEDYSFTLYMAADTGFVYMFFDVKDDKVVGADNASAWYRGDCIDLIISEAAKASEGTGDDVRIFGDKEGGLGTADARDLAKAPAIVDLFVKKTAEGYAVEVKLDRSVFTDANVFSFLAMSCACRTDKYETGTTSTTVYPVIDNAAGEGGNRAKAKLNEVKIVDVAVEEPEYNVTYTVNYDGTTCTITGMVDSTKTELNIPAEIDGYKVTAIDKSAFFECSSLESIVIPDSVTAIGSKVFFGCISLKSITIPNSVTSIGTQAFYSCTSLESITIPNSVTSIGLQAFDLCTGLESITIPGSVAFIDQGAFRSNTFGIIYCEAKSLPDGWHRSWCDSSANVVWDCNNNDIASDGYIHVIIDGINYGIKNGVAKVLRASSAIEAACITENIVYKDVAYKVISIDQRAFYECTGLTSITIPDSVTSIGNYAFYDCTALEEIYFNATSMDDLPTLNYVFNNAGNKSDGIKVIIGANVKKIPAYLFYPGSSFPNIVSVEFEDGSACTGIGAYAFYRCDNLTDITIPDSVTSIGENAFYDCSGLESIIFDGTIKQWSEITKYNGWDFLTGNYTIYCLDGTVAKDGTVKYKLNVKYTVNPDGTTCTITGMIDSTKTELNIPEEIDGYRVTTIGSGAFTNCTNLKTVIISNSVTSIGSYAFYGCTSLASITIGKGVKSVEEKAFADCTALEEIYFNATAMDDLTYRNTVFVNTNASSIGVKLVIGANVTKIPANLFSPAFNTYAPNIVSVEFTAGSVCTRIGSNSLHGCVNLTSISIPGNVTSIGDGAFYACQSLASITIPDRVTIIEHGMFSGCTRLTSITIPDSVTSIEEYVFLQCSSLESISFEGSVEQWSEVLKEENWDKDTGNYVVYCTDGTIAKDGTVTYGLNVNYTVNNDGTTCTVTGMIDLTNTKLNIPEEIDGYEVTAIESGAFKYCTNLKTVIISNSVTSIGDEAFYGCTNLQSLTIGEGVKSVGGKAFADCTALEEIYFNATAMYGLTYRNTVFANTSASSVEVKLIIGANVKRIPDALFSPDYNTHAPNIVSVEFAAGSTCTSIGNWSFHNCANLKSISISNSVTNIGEGAFQECVSLESIIFEGTSKQWAEISKYAYWDVVTSNYTIYCTDGTLAKETTGWW